MAGGVDGRGHGWQLAGVCGRGACVAEGGRAWQILRDTVNERAVRILLECILVNSFYRLNLGATKGYNKSDEDSQLKVITSSTPQKVAT